MATLVGSYLTPGGALKFNYREVRNVSGWSQRSDFSASAMSTGQLPHTIARFARLRRIDGRL